MYRGPYAEALAILDANPYLVCNGRVYANTVHYSHERSATLELNLEGWMGEGEHEQDIPESVHARFNALQDALQEQAVAFNKDMTKELYAALEYAQSDANLIEWMDNEEWRFDEDGEKVEMDYYMPVDNRRTAMPLDHRLEAGDGRGSLLAGSAK